MGEDGGKGAWEGAAGSAGISGGGGGGLGGGREAFAVSERLADTLDVLQVGVLDVPS